MEIDEYNILRGGVLRFVVFLLILLLSSQILWIFLSMLFLFRSALFMRLDDGQDPCASSVPSTIMMLMFRL